jgi:predicted RNA-binding Zn-ribbon protein involved in translation (DUF1610 family)
MIKFLKRLFQRVVCINCGWKGFAVNVPHTIIGLRCPECGKYNRIRARERTLDK